MAAETVQAVTAARAHVLDARAQQQCVVGGERAVGRDAVGRVARRIRAAVDVDAAERASRPAASLPQHEVTKP